MTENEVLPHITEYDTNKKEFSQTSCNESDTENCYEFIKKSSFTLQYLPVENSDLTVPP